MQLGLWETLSTREQANLLWLAALVVLLLAYRPTRAVLLGLPRALGEHLLPLLPPIGLFATYIGLVILLASPTPLWGAALTRDALLWLAIPGLSLFAKLGEVGTQGAYVRRHIAAMLGLDFLLLSYLDVITFDLAIELLLPPIAVSLVLWHQLARTEEAKQRAARVLGYFGFGLLIATTWTLWNNIAGLDAPYVLQRVVLPFWLTLAALPFVYGVGIYEAYRIALRLSETQHEARALRWLLRAFGTDATGLRSLKNYTVRQIGMASSYEEALAAIAKERADRQAEADARRRKAEDLVRYAGVGGTDEDGRQFDRREFESTTKALEELASRMSGWYQHRGGRFRRQVLATMEEKSRSGLSATDGLKMRVKRGGQAWMAWRRTPSGFVFALGGADDANDRRYYEGPTLPKGYPGEADGWEAIPGANWW